MKIFTQKYLIKSGDTWGETGHLSEYQNKKGWLLNIQDFKDEVTLITFLISSGELYFVNVNFIRGN